MTNPIDDTPVQNNPNAGPPLTARELFLDKDLVKKEICAFAASLTTPLVIDHDKVTKEELVDQVLAHLSQNKISYGFIDGKPVVSVEGAGDEDLTEPEPDPLLEKAKEVIELFEDEGEAYPIAVELRGRRFVVDGPEDEVYEVLSPAAVAAGDTSAYVRVVRIAVQGIGEKGARDLRAMVLSTFSSKNGCSVIDFATAWDISADPARAAEVYQMAIKLVRDSYGFLDAEKHVKQLV